MRFAIAILLPIIVGIIAALGTSLQFWFDMKEGLIAFLGFLSASLIQIMPVTANFLQSDRLTPSEASRLIRALTRQQRYWIGLLAATVLSMVIVIVGAALKGRTQFMLGDRGLDISPAVVWCIAAAISFVLTRILGLFNGLMSLHRLRSKLVQAAAVRYAEESRVEILSRFPDSGQTGKLPDGYGDIVESSDRET